MVVRFVSQGESGADATQLVVMTSDSKKALVSRRSFQMSQLIANLLMDLDDTDVGEIPLPEVSSSTLVTIDAYLERYVERIPPEVERPLRSALPEALDPWDYTYVYEKLLEGGQEHKNEMLFQVLKGSNYLGIDPLRNLCCAAIAGFVRNKSEEEVLTLFGISEPFTQEDEDTLCSEFPWLREPGGSTSGK